MILYHICKPEDKGKFYLGYVGVTNNYNWRKDQHFKYHHSNKLLQSSIKKYNAIMYPVSEGCEEEILRMEAWLRPEDNIGWNLVKGGGLPPNAKGRKWTKAQYEKVPKRGKSHGGWIGYWVVGDIYYESTKEASEALGVTRKTIRDRCNNPKFPEYRLERKRNGIQRLSRQGSRNVSDV